MDMGMDMDINSKAWLVTAYRLNGEIVYSHVLKIQNRTV